MASNSSDNIAQGHQDYAHFRLLLTNLTSEGDPVNNVSLERKLMNTFKPLEQVLPGMWERLNNQSSRQLGGDGDTLTRDQSATAAQTICQGLQWIDGVCEVEPIDEAKVLRECERIGLLVDEAKFANPEHYKHAVQRLESLAKGLSGQPLLHKSLSELCRTLLKMSRKWWDHFEATPTRTKATVSEAEELCSLLEGLLAVAHKNPSALYYFRVNTTKARIWALFHPGSHCVPPPPPISQANFRAHQQALLYTTHGDLHSNGQHLLAEIRMIVGCLKSLPASTWKALTESKAAWDPTWSNLSIINCMVNDMLTSRYDGRLTIELVKEYKRAIEIVFTSARLEIHFDDWESAPVEYGRAHPVDHVHSNVFSPIAR